mgnify:CR=1 FL=1
MVEINPDITKARTLSSNYYTDSKIFHSIFSKFGRYWQYIGHTSEFWNNFKFILKEAIDHNIYKDIDFKNHPKNYCGMKITNSPLDT